MLGRRSPTRITSFIFVQPAVQTSVIRSTSLTFSVPSRVRLGGTGVPHPPAELHRNSNSRSKVGDKIDPFRVCALFGLISPLVLVFAMVRKLSTMGAFRYLSIRADVGSKGLGPVPSPTRYELLTSPVLKVSAYCSLVP
jgi:hypothetical protein